jgi:putative transposase
MTLPRAIIPGRFLFITRSCTQRQFLLRPDPETNNTFTYCLAEAAKRFGIVVVLAQMMSNHHHMIVYDPDGKQVQFREHFHKMFAKAQNALRGRWENLWSSEETCVIELGPEDLLAKLVYTAINPVKDNLVERVEHWPGPNFVDALLNGQPMHAHRPAHFFREQGCMPPEVELVMKLPDDFEGKDALLEKLREMITAFEEAYARQRER